MLDHALSYAERGWRVLPIHGLMPDGTCTCGKPCGKSAGKHPVIKDWVTAATTDKARIENLYRRHPEFNIGLATGEGSGFFALDVDPKAGGTDSLAQLCMEHGALPLTLTAVTGSGGRHFFFQHLKGQGNKVGFAPGLDIRGDGGQVVAAPSKHLSGGRYSWVSFGIPIAPAPPWLIDILQPSGERPPEGRSPDEWGKMFLAGAPEGGRNDTAAKIGGYLFRRGIDPYMVYEIMQMWNAKHVRPPLHPEEIRTIMNSVAQKEFKRLTKGRIGNEAHGAIKPTQDQE